MIPKILLNAKRWGGGPPRSGGGGVLPLGANPHYAVRDSGGVGENIFRGDTQHPYPLRFEPFGAGLIALRSIAHVVSDAVNFDSELELRRVEIEHIASDRVLAPEFDMPGLLT